MILSNGFEIITITVCRYTGWLYIIEPHFITTGTTLIGDDKQAAKNIATKRIYATADVYDFAFDEQHQIIHLPDEIEYDPDSKVFHRIWDADNKVWCHELANYQLS
jgi:hypothetical protein